MKRKSKSGPTEARCSAVVDGPHERHGPGANQLSEEDPGYQGQAVRNAAHWTLGILQQSSHQESLGTHREEKQKSGHGGKRISGEIVTIANRSIRSKTTRLRDSFIPQAIRLLNT